MAGGGTGYGGSQHEGAVMAAPGAPKTTELVYTAPEEPVKEVYVVRPKRTTTSEETDPVKNVAIEMTAVDDYMFSSNFDVLENLSKGMYTNTLLTHDLVRMTYDRLQFDMYDVNELGTEVITAVPGGPDVMEIKEFVKAAKDARTISDKFTHLEKGKLCTPNQDALRKQPTKEEALLCFYPTNLNHDVVFGEDLGAEAVSGGIKSSLNIVPNRVEQWMQSRMVQSQQLNNIKLSVRAPGLSTRTVGDVIEFKMPTQFLEDRDGETQATHHKYLSGYYLITKLRHHFTKEKYEIEFEAIKDSLNAKAGKGKGEADDPRSASTGGTPAPLTVGIQ